jgi:hypothetical protein
MFSHVDGWAEQGSDLDDRQQSSLNCANPRHALLSGGVAGIAETPCKNLPSAPQGSPRPAARARA